ncbi:transposase [Microbacterium amylolyticum]|uniref:Transposase n=1 Tax=Microbacterium amylolyticum TaxID=936337 RepID=A0ABS4ZH34_9MICO|nr:transposase [Microbacterium amylolyticum]
MKPKNLVIVRAVREQGLTLAEAAARFGITRQWVHTLVRRYDAEGPDRVTPRSRAPKTQPGTTATAIRDRIIELRGELVSQGADAGPVTIAWHLEQDGHRAPSTSTIRRILHTAGLITPAPHKRPRSSYIRFQADLPNECWQADITHWHLANGTRVEILDFLDDHSRLLLDIRAQAAFTGPMVVTAMTELIDHYGAPMSTLTDNGLVFTTRLARHKGARGGFEKLLAAHRITQKTAGPDTRKPRARSNASTKP